MVWVLGFGFRAGSRGSCDNGGDVMTVVFRNVGLFAFLVVLVRPGGCIGWGQGATNKCLIG